MFTPQDAREKATFEKAVFGGYNMSTVDDYVSALLDDYAALYKENAVLKSKMKVLVERLEEANAKEESMSKVLIAAQKTADEMTIEAERKCAKMVSDAEEALRQRNQDLKQELAAEAERVSRARKTATAYISEMEAKVQECMDQLEAIKHMAISPKEYSQAGKTNARPAEETPAVQQPAAVETKEDVSRQIEESLNRMLAEGAPADNTGDTRVIPAIVE